MKVAFSLFFALIAISNAHKLHLQQDCNTEHIYYYDVMKSIVGDSFEKNGVLNWKYDDFQFVEAMTIYFTASWCSPCRSFSPDLQDFYVGVNTGCFYYENVVVDFSSSNQAHHDYLDKYDFATIPYGDGRINSLDNKYGVSGIPKLILVHKDGSVANGNARSDVSNGGVSKFDSWKATVAAYSNSQYEGNNDNNNDNNDEPEDWVDNTGYSYCPSCWVGDGICDPVCAVENNDGGDCDNLPDGCTLGMIGDNTCDQECYAQSTYYDWGDCPNGPEDDPDFGNDEPEDWVDNTGYSSCPSCWVGDGICDPVCAVTSNNDGGDCDNLPAGCTLGMIGDKTCDVECYAQSTYYDWGDCPNGPSDDTTQGDDQTTDNTDDECNGDDCICNTEEIYYREPVTAIIGTQFSKKGHSTWTYDDFAKVEAITVYFTASWCGPCQSFTPDLDDFYNEVNGGSCFRYENVASLYEYTTSAYNTYADKMSFARQPYSTYGVYSTYSVSGIPTLILIHKDGSEANRNARSDVSNGGASKFEDWVDTVASYSNPQYESTDGGNTDDGTTDDSNNGGNTDDGTTNDSNNDGDSNGQPAGVNDASWIAFLETNKFRNSEGKTDNEWDQLLYELCVDHNGYQINAGTISHDNFSERCSAIPGWSSCAENVAYNYDNENPGAKAVDQWINSSGHRANMLSDHTYQGVAGEKDSGTGRWYFCQFFANHS